MDIVGVLYYGKGRTTAGAGHAAWSGGQSMGIQHSSITTCLYWVFNQSVIPWMMTLCFLMDSDERNYVTYGAACLICGPLPLIGLAVLMVFRAVCRLIRCIREQRVQRLVQGHILGGKSIGGHSVCSNGGGLFAQQ